MTKTPRFEINAGDSVAVKESSRARPLQEASPGRRPDAPRLARDDPEAFTARILALATRDQIEAQLNTQLIVEHSR